MSIPTLKQTFKPLTEATVLIDLLPDEPCPQMFSEIAPLKASLNSIEKTLSRNSEI